MVCLGNTTDEHPELAWKIRARGQGWAAAREMTDKGGEVQVSRTSRCLRGHLEVEVHVSWRRTVRDSRLEGTPVGVSKEPAKWKCLTNRAVVLNTFYGPGKPVSDWQQSRNTFSELLPPITPSASEKMAEQTREEELEKPKKLATHTLFHPARLWGCSRDRNGETTDLLRIYTGLVYQLLHWDEQRGFWSDYLA